MRNVNFIRISGEDSKGVLRYVCSECVYGRVFVCVCVWIQVPVCVCAHVHIHANDITVNKGEIAMCGSDLHVSLGPQWYGPTKQLSHPIAATTYGHKKTRTYLPVKAARPLVKLVA